MSVDEIAALRESERIYRALFHANSDALFLHDTEGRILLGNREMCAMFGYEPEEATSLSIADLSAGVPPYTQTDGMARIAQALREGRCVFEWQSRRRSGELFWSEVALRAFDMAGETRVLACVREISARKQMETALLASEERFSKIFHSTTSMLAFTEPREGRIIDVNDTWLAASGLTRDAAIGMTGKQLALWSRPEDRDVILAELGRVGRVVDYEAVLTMGGKALPCLISTEFVDIREERFILWEIRDLSERKRAEAEREKLKAQLLQAQKMESVGRLAGGVAHDFNNILTVINGSCELLLAVAPSSDPRWSSLADIRSAGARAAELTRQLLVFSRQQVVQQRVLDLNAVVSETEHLLRRLIGEDIELLVILDPALAPVRADAGQLGQVLMNLVVNARDAMPRGGRLTVETSNVSIDEPTAMRHADAVAGRYVRLTVTDAGSGMAPEVQQHLFEPFFTTKPRGSGTGLGLPTVYGIVRQSGGWIAVRSAVGVGSTFEIHFPRAEGRTEGAQATSDGASPTRGTETVLMVEDQADVRRFITRVLGALGYRVLEAETGERALAIAAAHDGAIDVLVTDVVMPGMSGRVVAERLRETRPDTKVLYLSGYTDDVIVLHGVRDDGLAFLQKPFTPATLSRKLRELLAAPGRRT